ncbi:halocyanin domain-containing protein [Haloplanus pelagicus]|jgi:halocyanin-like protein|uniref:halocyanin domain-containing protein n=1 Tax=Haloplanus pelagicus TaxID=2949995 RepID=UPI00203B38B6|nr:halocyanin domain-containing protein [Haloplanus sp. HW8-1]
MTGTDPTDRSVLTRRGALRAAAGTVAAGTTAAGLGARPVAAQNGVDYGGWFGSSRGAETQNFDGTVDRTGQDSVTVEVGAEGNGGPYAFGPAAVRIDPGTTVTFEWVSDTHNILLESQPSGAGWQGVESIENSGYSHEHTFETEGIYKYYCQPHLALGMKGALVVGGGGGDGGGGGGGDGGGGEAGGGGGGGDGGGGGEAGGASPTLSLAFRLVGGAVAAALALVLGVTAWVFLNYDEFTTTGETDTTPSQAARAPSESVFEAGAVRDLDHDDYDPYGTATLIAIYVGIISLLWVFMYFVEFLGGGPTVIG